MFKQLCVIAIAIVIVIKALPMDKSLFVAPELVLHNLFGDPTIRSSQTE